MKRSFVTVLTLLLLCISGITSSQSLQFCEDVGSNGAAIKPSTVFSISTKGGYLKCLTTLPYTVGTSSVSYEVYRIDSEGNETYDNSIQQTVDPGYTWFWKEITFYDEGRYNIYVYDSDKNFLASEQIRIQYY
ncbi:MAG: hypothetical protein ABI462_05495 [Ignavibacteria bacterium]